MSANVRRASHRIGFTLVELLVVIAIIGILVALLLPAVQAAREAARRASCQNNIKNIAIALLNFHDARKAFPPGFAAGNTNSTGKPLWGWTAFALPGLEEQALHDALDPTQRQLFNVFTAGAGDPQQIALLQTPLAIFRCPSDETPPLLPNDGGNCPSVGNPQCKRNFYASGFTTTSFQPATSNYMGNRGFIDAGCQPASRPLRCLSNGVLYGNSSVAITHITDGTSKTFLLGERDGFCWAGTWIGIRNADGPNMFSSYYVLGRVSVDLNYPSDIDDACTEGFSSKHAGGAFFAFCDGSVQFINDDINSSLGPNQDTCVVKAASYLSDPVCQPEVDGTQIGVYQRLGWRDDALVVHGL